MLKSIHTAVIALAISALGCGQLADIAELVEEVEPTEAEMIVATLTPDPAAPTDEPTQVPPTEPPPPPEEPSREPPPPNNDGPPPDDNDDRQPDDDNPPPPPGPRLEEEDLATAVPLGVAEEICADILTEEEWETIIGFELLDVFAESADYIGPLVFCDAEFDEAFASVGIQLFDRPEDAQDAFNFLRQIEEDEGFIPEPVPNLGEAAFIVTDGEEQILYTHDGAYLLDFLYAAEEPATLLQFINWAVLVYERLPANMESFPDLEDDGV